MRLAFLLLFAIGVALNAVVAKGLVEPYWDTHETTGWPETTCTVARTWDDGSGQRVSYAYAIGGQAYLGERIDFLGRSYPDTFTDGEARPCWYDADEPSSSVLVRDDLWRASDWILIGLFAAIAAGLAFVIALGTTRARRLGAAILRAMLAANLVALAWLAHDGGASGVHAAGLTILAAGACVWLAVSVRRAFAPRVPAARVM